VERLIERVVSVAGDQDAALSAVGLTELIHGVYARKHHRCAFAVKPSPKS
jgi:hypothetical protein